MSTILITGRLPELSIAELESLYGSSALTRLGDHALVDADVDFARLGGSIKSAHYLTTLETTNPQKAFDFCRKALPDYIKDIPEGKIKLGVSMYGFSMPLHKQNANVLSLKKTIKNAGRSVRAVPNTEAALSSAQTYHNSLTSQLGLELVFLAHGGKIYIGHVQDVQDIDSYTLRDRGRPKRDTFVGMLPPKLAQTIINIATGTLSSDMPGEQTPPVILDPFCGTGVVLQEAALMGYGVYGTDLSEKMVRYSRDNLNWAQDTFRIRTGWQLETGDAMTHTWRQPIDVVACEGYLGQPLGGQHPTPEKLAEIMHECNTIMQNFFKNIAPQLKSGTRLCVAVPVWFIANKTHHLPMTEHIESLGYENVTFSFISTDKLIYSRDDQITGRQLLTLVRK